MSASCSRCAVPQRCRQTVELGFKCPVRAAILPLSREGVTHPTCDVECVAQVSTKALIGGSRAFLQEPEHLVLDLNGDAVGVRDLYDEPLHHGLHV